MQHLIAINAQSNYERRRRKIQTNLKIKVLPHHKIFLITIYFL